MGFDSFVCGNLIYTNLVFIMDSYDEVHDVKNGRNVETPPELDLSVSSAIKFINNDPEDEEDFDGNEHHLIEDEVIDGN